ncbi:MAG: transporter, partial [Fusobacteriales bacterium]|nr:transporter [Fusobacteriales bacterium]
MKRNKKLLVSFLAINSILSAYAAGTETVVSPRYDRMYNSIVKNIEKGSSNQKTYEIIEQILNQKNKELKDLYLRGDYIVKPEYLEWQVFFTGFYEEYSEGRDNTKENAAYHSKVSGYYDTNGNYVMTSGSINGMMGKPHKQLQQPKEIDLGVTVQVREPSRQPVSLGVSKPSMPQITPNSPAAVAVNPPVIPLMPNLSFEINPPATFSVPSVSTSISLNLPTIAVRAFNPVAPSVTTITIDPVSTLTLTFPGSGNGDQQWINKGGSVAPIAQQDFTGQSGKGTLDAVSLSTAASQNFNVSLHNTNAVGRTGTSHTATNNGIQNFDWTGVTASHAVMKLVGSHEIQIKNMDMKFIGVGNKPSAYLMLFHTDAHNFAGMESTWNLDSNTTVTMSGQKIILYGVQSHSGYASGSGMINNGIITADGETTAATSQGTSYTGLNPDQRIIFTTIDADGGSLSSYSRWFYFINNGTITLNGTSDILANFATPGNIGRGTYFTNNSAIYLNGQSSVGIMLNPSVSNFGDSHILLNTPIEIRGDKSLGIQLTNDVFKLEKSIINLNLGTTGNDSNSTGNIAGNNPGLVEGAVGVLVSEAAANFTLKDYKINIGDHSFSNAGIRVAAGKISLSTGGNSSIDFSANSSENAGVSITGGSSTATTAGITINLNGTSNVGAQVENSGTFNHSNGTINIGGQGNLGIATLSGATTNMNNASAVINVGAKGTGAYNNSVFNLTAGTIKATGDSAVAVYGAAGNINTNINDGNIEVGSGGIALFSGNSSKINIKSAADIKVNAGGLLFYNHDGGMFTGKYVLDGIVSPRVEAGGMVFYYKGGSLSNSELSGMSAISSSFEGKTALGTTDKLDLRMAAGSSLIYLESTPGLTKNISDLSLILPLVPLSGAWLTVTPDSGAVIKTYTLSDLNLILDNDTDSNLDGGIYSKLQILSSDITVNNGVTVNGTNNGQIAIVQRNKTGSTNPSDILITNNGTINLTGDNSVGIVGDYAKTDTSSSSKIELYGDKSTGIISTNGTQTTNAGTIIIDGDKAMGIYGGNTLDDTPAVLGYGNGKINITHSGEIKTTNATGERYGIYVENKAAYSVPVTDSTVTTTAGSKIDLSLAANGGVGIYSDKSTVNHSGSVKISSTATNNGTGIYAIAGSNVEILNTGSLEVTGEKGYGFFLKDSAGKNSGSITVGKESIGINLDALSTGNNNGTLTIGESSAGMYVGGTSTGNNNAGALITSSDSEALGIYVLSGATGTNAGNITLTGQKSSGIYNKGTFTMTGGTVEVNSVSGAGIYADTGSTTNINAGAIKAGKGAIALYADSSTINVAGGTNFDISGDTDGKSIFAYNYNNLGVMTTGKVNLTGTTNTIVNINSGGIGFYVKGMTLDTYINNLISNSGTGKLEIVMKNSDSNLYVLDSPGSPTQLSTISSLVPGTTLGSAGNVVISTGSVSDYGLLTLVKGELEIDQDVNLDTASDAYNKSDFVNSSVKLNAGKSITGTAANALGIGQRNYSGGTLANLLVQNDGTINLTGMKSTGIAVDFGRVQNSAGAVINVGEDGIGIYAANSSQVTNAGAINLTNNGVGIYGANYFDGVTSMPYGTDDIDITNSGDIISTGTTGRNIGIYANNRPSTPGPVSTVALNTGSNIDVSSSEEGIGVYAVDSILTINDGNITVGKNGIGIYAEGTTGTIAGGTVNLTGDNAIGYYLAAGSSFTNTGGNIYIDGQNIILTISDSTSSMNFLTPFNITATAGSTYVAGSMTGGEFYNNTTATLGSNGMLISGLGTAALFGTASDVNSSGTNVAGMLISGQYTDNPFPHIISGTPVNVEGTNLGIMNLGDSSAGIYLMNDARGENRGTITMGNYSVGMYAEGSLSLSASSVKNDNGTINIGQESTGLFLKNGASVWNAGATAEINSTSQKAVGMYSERSSAGATAVINDGKIELNGDQSIGIYTTGVSNVTNNGTILIGSSLSPIQPGVGIYADNAGSSVVNSSGKSVTVGDNSIGIYNMNGSVTNDGIITAGNGGTGIYSEGGTITLNAGSSITTGQNDAVGVYAVNQTGTVVNNSAVSVGDGSYGFV